jgi:transcriptional regulator with XRE-family HTH domain
MPGTIIKKHRESKKFTQDFVAREMNISQNAYSKIETGGTTLTVHHLKELSRVFQVSITDLIKDNFEIHRPNHIKKQSISKDQLLMTIDSLREKLHKKHPLKHDFYPILMSLFQTIENTIEEIH